MASERKCTTTGKDRRGGVKTHKLRTLATRDRDPRKGENREESVD